MQRIEWEVLKIEEKFTLCLSNIKDFSKTFNSENAREKDGKNQPSYPGWLA